MAKNGSRRTGNNDNRLLDKRMRKVIDAMIKHPSDSLKSIASRSGVTYRTIFNYLNRDEFRTELAERREEAQRQKGGQSPISAEPNTDAQATDFESPTKDYSLFEPHPFNRKIGNTRVLKMSMQMYGFRKEKAILVVRSEHGKLRIKEGHHRFHVAKELGLPIYFHITDDDFPVYLSERTASKWTINDYAESYYRGSKSPDYAEVYEFHEKYGIPIQCCVSLFGGQSANSANFTDEFKRGDFKIRPSGRELANNVRKVVEAAEEAGLPFAKNTNFVKAVSKIVLIPKEEDFDLRRLIHKIKSYPKLIKPSTDIYGYVVGLSEAYARQSSMGSLELLRMAEETAKARNAVKVG